MVDRKSYEIDDVIEDYIHISVGSHLVGIVHAGARTWIGIGTTVRNNEIIC